jgi:hypothetical protein
MPSKTAKDAILLAETLPDFLQLVSKERANWDFDKEDVGGPWFRGHQRKHWGLETVIRKTKCGKNSL